MQNHSKGQSRSWISPSARAQPCEDFAPRRAQGALEYLLLIGGAVVVASIVVVLILALSGANASQAQTNAMLIDQKKILTLAGVAPTGAAGYYPFDVSFGNGTPGGGVQIGVADATRGKVASFDGTNQAYIAVPTSSLSSLNGTVSGWVKPSIPDVWGFWQTHDDPNTNWNDWISVFAWWGTFYYRVGDGSGCCNNDLTFSNTDIPVGQWTFLAFTWDSTGLKIYQNGTLKNQRSAVLQSYIDPKARIGFGHTVPMNGSMDDFMMFGRALSAGEITSLYNYQRK